MLKGSGNPIDISIVLKLGCVVCLISAKLLGIFFPASIVKISGNFFFNYWSEKNGKKKRVKNRPEWWRYYDIGWAFKDLQPHNRQAKKIKNKNGWRDSLGRQ